MMSRAQKDNPRAQPVEPLVFDEANLPPVVPARKHPWLLALAVLLFGSWLSFLLWMAVYG